SDQLRLKSPAAQRRALDAYGGKILATALTRYRKTYDNLQSVSGELQELQQQAQERALEAQNLQRSLEEIDDANIEDHEDTELQELIKRLESAEEFRSAAHVSTTVLSGDDNDLDAPSAESLVELARQTIDQTPGELVVLDECCNRMSMVCMYI